MAGLGTNVAVLAAGDRGYCRGCATCLRLALSAKLVTDGGGEMLEKGSSSIRYTEGDAVRKLVDPGLGFVNDEPGCLGAEDDRGRDSNVGGADEGFVDVGGD